VLPLEVLPPRRLSRVRRLETSARRSRPPAATNSRSAEAHQATEREHLPNHPRTGDEQVKGAVAGGVGGAVVGAIVGGPVGAVVGGAIGAMSGAAVGEGAEAVDEKS
jgi:Glycine zipper